MARHHSYSKRSRESRKAMTDGSVDDGYPDCCECMTEDWSALADEISLPSDPVG
ncbi:hypothetical protein K3U94_09400 [Mycolicibacter heraklionensis]|uniref:Uncharacterized protein n=1 Tax=Mycolicibacter heraklionensis TaxID=512402 RepID=A0A9X7WJK3_9MYCO|nr:hypothetical protein [Mycolicibacter heraklionensis]QZA09420.1 hypothetical protein K3U94_09400 [Mycolicibacter heraklionensis]